MCELNSSDYVAIGAFIIAALAFIFSIVQFLEKKAHDKRMNAPNLYLVRTDLLPKTNKGRIVITNTGMGVAKIYFLQVKIEGKKQISAIQPLDAHKEFEKAKRLEPGIHMDYRTKLPIDLVPERSIEIMFVIDGKKGGLEKLKYIEKINTEIKYRSVFDDEYALINP